MDPELELLARWRAGDRDAGETLLARHLASLHRFFRSKLPAEAQDLVQRTLLDVVEARDAVADHVSLRAYLFAVARHRLVDHLRQRAVRGTPVDPASTTLAFLGTTPSAAVARDEQHALLEQAMRELPIDLQLVLELAYWENLAGPEIAEVVGVGANTVRGRLARARAALRERLDALHAAPEALAGARAMFDHVSRERSHDP